MKKQKSLITTSWDDGNPLDLKLCSVLKKYDIKGTIYMPIKNKDEKILNEDEIRDISKDFEIGGHYTYDISLTNIDNEELYNQLYYSKKELEHIIKKELKSFSYPNGQFNENVIKNIKKIGFKSGRTAELFRTDITDPFKFHTTIQATNRIFLSKVKQALNTNNNGLVRKLVLEKNFFKNWNVLAKKTFDYVIENGGIWHLWGHSLEIDENNDWDILEDLLSYVENKGKKNNADFLTNNEVIKQYYSD
jgi:hypothetical protein